MMLGLIVLVIRPMYAIILFVGRTHKVHMDRQG